MKLALVLTSTMGPLSPPPPPPHAANKPQVASAIQQSERFIESLSSRKKETHGRAVGPSTCTSYFAANYTFSYKKVNRWLTHAAAYTISIKAGGPKYRKLLPCWRHGSACGL